MDVFDSELSGDFRYLAKNLFLGPIQVLAAELYKTLSKTGSAGGDINDIICCLNPTEIAALQTAYLEGEWVGGFFYQRRVTGLRSAGSFPAVFVRPS